MVKIAAMLLILIVCGCSDGSVKHKARAEAAAVFVFAKSEPPQYVPPPPIVKPKSAKTYAEKFAAAKEDGKPIVFLITETWCQPCHKLEAALLDAGFDERQDIHFHAADGTNDATGRKFKQGSGVPQLWLFTQTRDGWARRVIRGTPRGGVAAVNDWIRRGVADARN